MSVPNEQLQRAINQAKVRESQGYFTKVKVGDQKAASLFVKLIAFDLNPTGSGADFGWLSKSSGETQVDGFAEDAICFTSDPSNLQNVVDMVNGAGAPNASIGGGVKERRVNNLWVKPKALTAEELTYIFVSVSPPQATQPPGREEALDEMKWLDSYYSAPEGLQRPNGLSLNGKPDFEGIAAWYLDIYQRERMALKSRADSRAKYVSDIRHSFEWRQKHPGETP
jgi:hypothetical protein